MRYIMDSIHGAVELNSTEFKLVDTPQVQRLRKIKQLGFVYLAYPGAVHTRLEHGLGVAHLVKLVGRGTNLDSSVIKTLRIAAILHDIGHGPLSHESEPILERYTKQNHEERGASIIKTELASMLFKAGVDPVTIADLVTGKSNLYYASLLRGHFDVDYLDNIGRDAHYTGVTQGQVDSQRLASIIIFKNNKLYVLKKGRPSLESYFVSRHLMFESVYHHHVSKIAAKMLQKALELAFEDKSLSADAVWDMGDDELMRRLVEIGGISSELARRIEDRRLYKRLIYLPHSKVPPHLLNKLLVLRESTKRLAQLEKEIAETFKVDPHKILVSIPKPPERSLSQNGKEMLEFMNSDGSTIPISEGSSIIRNLKTSEWDVWRFGVFVEPKLRRKLDSEKVVRIIEDFKVAD